MKHESSKQHERTHTGVIALKKATAAEIRGSLGVKPRNESVARKANRVAKKALQFGS